MFMRRRCVVCGLHVRRSDWRAERVLVGGELVVFGRVARNLVPSDAAIAALIRGTR